MPITLTLLLFFAQATPARPDFSGTWVVDEAKTAALKARGGAPPTASGGAGAQALGEVVIAQTPASMAMTTTGSLSPIVQTYALDGSESTNRSGAVVQITKQRWDGRRLVIEGTKSQVTSAGAEKWQFSQTLSLDASGALVIESRHLLTSGVTTGVVAFKRKTKPA